MATIKYTSTSGEQGEIEVNLTEGIKVEGIENTQEWVFTTVNVDNVDFVSPHWGERPTREER